jgi:hypothetical protein
MFVLMKVRRADAAAIETYKKFAATGYRLPLCQNQRSAIGTLR